MKLKTLTHTILLVIFILVAGRFALAYEFEETFDSYADNTNAENLDKWNLPPASSLWYVKDDDSFSPPNSMAYMTSTINSGSNIFYTLGFNFEVAQFKIKIADDGLLPTTETLVNLGEISTWYYDVGVSALKPYSRTCIWWNNTSGKIDLVVYSSSYGCYVSDPNPTYILQNIPINTWDTLVIDFDLASESYRIQSVNLNEYSGWISENYSWNTLASPTEIKLTHASGGVNAFYDDFAFDYPLPAFAITAPQMDEAVIKDSWITVQGVCPTDGTNQIALTNDCSDFSNLDYTVDCVNGTFLDQFYYNGISDWVVAVDKNSVTGDCVDYDDLMDGVQVYGIEIIEGYPDDWFFNFNYYDDYDIKINYPVFNTALTLPKGTATSTFSFNFVYPHPLAPNLTFKILQYDDNGNLLNGNYHSTNLINMPNTSDYQVDINASSTANIHYVVQLFRDIDLVRQYPFMVAVSDLDIIINTDNFKHLFPRLVEELKTKVIFNYYFAFHDGFYNMFNATTTAIAEDAMDITFKSVSANGEYNLDVPIFSASDERVKSFTDGIRPWVTALLWLLFALYVVFRVTHLFSDNQ